MKSMVVYSSRTGNTRKVARAIFDILPEPKDIFPVEDAPAVNGYDLVVIGFWVDKGRPDDRAARYLKSVEGTAIGLFGTLGADPDSEHAHSCLSQALELASGNHVAGTFLCQGRIDPKVVETMRTTAADVHPMTPERIARIASAESHPDATDLEHAQGAALKMLQSAREAVQPCGR